MGGRGSGSRMSGGNSNFVSQYSTKGRMRQVGANEWQGENDNGSYAAVTKLPSNLSTLNKQALQEVARGLGEPNRNVDGVGKKALIDTIKGHGSNVYRVSRTEFLDRGRSSSKWETPLFATNRSAAMNYAKGWLRANKNR